MTKQISERPPRLLRLAEVSAMTTLQRAAIYEKMSCNQFPQARRISSRCTVWDEREILAWMEALPRGVGRRPGKTPDATSAAA